MVGVDMYFEAVYVTRCYKQRIQFSQGSFEIVIVFAGLVN